MQDIDPVMADLDRYLDESEEDYECPYEARAAREEYLADQEDT
jgi:hypothetical protein|tara:strand:+ start:502 stop:630 length:129 start_codon:yes stop_codon:yes gene_type:complete